MGKIIIPGCALAILIAVVGGTILLAASYYIGIVVAKLAGG